MSPAPEAASIVVPTYREAANLTPLIKQIFSATAQADIEAELIIVDDNSQDGTDAIVDSLAAEYPVRLIVRQSERGLASAVVAGLGQARHDTAVVLDADLQHPPEMVPELVRRLKSSDCDFVIATRYGPGGGIAGDWPLIRRLISWVATSLAKPLAPLSDPMSGFFAVKRETWERAAPLDPIGFKIALELYVKGRCSKPAEVPIRFEKRTAGKSKLDFGQQAQYLRHLVRLYRFKFPRLTILLPFMAAACIIGLAMIISGKIGPWLGGCG